MESWLNYVMAAQIARDREERQRHNCLLRKEVAEYKRMHTLRSRIFGGKSMVSNLYRLFYGELVRFMTKNTGSAAEAEDIVQETFLRALEHTQQLESMDEPHGRAWLYRTAKNVCIDRFRHRKLEPVLKRGETHSDDLSRGMVLQLFNVLEPKERAMFWMRYFEGYNAAEIGEIFNMPSSTVRAKLLLARKRLREYYQE